MRLKAQKAQEGFVLPLALMLITVLSISGVCFYHLNSMEILAAWHEMDNHGSFYLANTGIERAREVLKIPDNLLWTDILQANTSGYTADPSEPLLCDDPNGRGCVILPFGGTVTPASPNSFPFDATFNNGAYTVRVFDNTGDPDPNAKTDGDGIITIRALGTIRGEQKQLQADVIATSNLKLINCQGDPGVDPCPDDQIGSAADIKPSEGKEPDSTPTLPAMSPPLNDPDNFYRDPDNLAGLTLTNIQILSGNIILTTSPNPHKPEEVKIKDNSYYLTNGNVSIKDTSSGPNGNSGVVVFSTGGSVEMKSGTLTDAILIGANSVSLKGSTVLKAPLPYPAIVSGATVNGDNGVTIYGTVYAAGEIRLQPISIHGVLIGDPVILQGGGDFTDDGNSAYYVFMPGFHYPNELKTTKVVGGSWQEVE